MCVNRPLITAFLWTKAPTGGFVDKIEWFIWNYPPEPRPQFFVFAQWSGMRGRSICGKDAFKTLLHVIIRCKWQKQTRKWFCYLWSSEVIPWTLVIVPEKPKSSRKGIAWWMWRRWLYLQVVLEILGSSSNGNGKKKNNSNRFGLAKQQPCTSITLFCTLLAVAARLRRETD